MSKTKQQPFLVSRSVLPTPRFIRPIGLLWNPMPRVKKLLGGWPKIGLLFIRLPAAALFSSNLAVSCQFREFLSLFNAQEHSFHQFQGLRRKSNQYRLSTSRGSQQSNCFSAHLGDFGYFTAEKHPNLGNWAYDYLIKIGLLWSHLPRVKKPIYRGLVLRSFGNTDRDSRRWRPFERSDASEQEQLYKDFCTLITHW